MNDDIPLKKDNRVLFIALAYVAAACLIFASFSERWLENTKSKHQSVGFGLRGMHGCMESECESMSNSAAIEKIKKMQEQFDDMRREMAEMGRPMPKQDDLYSSIFVPMGWATFIECLIAALGLIATATLALRKMRVNWPVMPQSIALLMLMATLITAMLFVAKKPGGVGSVGVGITFWIYGVGAVVGIAAAQGLSKLIRPIDPDLAAGAMNPEHY